MLDRGLQGIRRGSPRVTTMITAHTANRPTGQPANRPADHVSRHLTVSAPNRPWAVDFTYVRTMGGKVLMPP